MIEVVTMTQSFRQGTQFMGDLLPNGHIRWTENKQVFSTPSSWVNHCKRIVNPENTGKTSSAWSSIRYQGKRLDSYKLRWYRRQKKIVSNAHVLDSAAASSSAFNPAKFNELANMNNASKEGQYAAQEFDDPVRMRERNVFEHTSLPHRTLADIDTNLMVKCTLFSAIDRIQPFTMSMSTNALLLIDFHCHLTNGNYALCY